MMLLAVPARTGGGEGAPVRGRHGRRPWVTPGWATPDKPLCWEHGHYFEDGQGRARLGRVERCRMGLSRAGQRYWDRLGRDGRTSRDREMQGWAGQEGPCRDTGHEERVLMIKTRLALEAAAMSRAACEQAGTPGRKGT